MPLRAPSGFSPAASATRFGNRRPTSRIAGTPGSIFLRPALTASLVLLWLGSGLAGLTHPPLEWREDASRFGISASAAGTATWVFCLLDIALALAIASGRAQRFLGIFQLALVAGYTFGLSLLMPALWLDPFGALLKNLPILAAIGVWTALQDDK